MKVFRFLPCEKRSDAAALQRRSREKGGAASAGPRVVQKLDSAGFATTIVPMSQAMPVDALKSERVTWKQIRERYPGEWAVLVEMDWNEDNDLDLESGTAIVIGHFKSRKESSPFIKASFQHYNRIASFWTGELRGPTPRFILP
jgi:hypothetical protein